MGRIVWILVSFLILGTLLVGCGEKSAEEIIRDLSTQSEKIESYKSKGKMTIETGMEPQEYEVEVWYKKPHYYRVALNNLKKDVTQILLRNDDGVYVLTPHLKKSFRFMSDWPESSGQVYLYKTLLQSIMDDPERKFEPGEKGYQFEVVANYTQNQSLSTQRIWLNKNLQPEKVDVLDDEGKVMVKVIFDEFKEGVSFDDDAFEVDRNMSVTEGKASPTTVEPNKKEANLRVVTPGWIPEGSRLVDEQTVDRPEGKVVIMRYQGEQPFTLTQERQRAIEASLPLQGKPIHLGFTTGVLLETEAKKRLSWTHEGTDFELYGNLAVQDMIRIAESVLDQRDK